ncbi:hypothetical protein [Pseudarthrobacter sp. S9]|uniref:hypothetical protein n=1 Tax=Pseudarthrobacter sp. S9 TaxID=3418421 RepID=UPI003D07CC8C
MLASLARGGRMIDAGQLAMLRELGSFRAINYTVTADGDRWQQGAVLISVANGQSIGGGMKRRHERATISRPTPTASGSGHYPDH